MNDNVSIAIATQPNGTARLTPIRATSIPPGIPNTVATSIGKETDSPAAARLIW